MTTRNIVPRVDGEGGIGTAAKHWGDVFTDSLTAGESAPTIKFKKLTGTTAAAEGGTVNVAHGLTASKILAVTVMVEWAANSFITDSYNGSAEYEFNWFFDGTNVTVMNSASNSGSILSKPIKIMIVYEA